MKDDKSIDKHTKEIADGLAMFSNGMVNAFGHLDQCMHEVKDEVSELKDDVKMYRDDVIKSRKEINKTFEKVLERLPQNTTSS